MRTSCVIAVERARASGRARRLRRWRSVGGRAVARAAAQPDVGGLPRPRAVAHRDALPRDVGELLVADAPVAGEAQPGGHLGRLLGGEIGEPRLVVEEAAELDDGRGGVPGLERGLGEVAAGPVVAGCDSRAAVVRRLDGPGVAILRFVLRRGVGVGVLDAELLRRVDGRAGGEVGAVQADAV
jgi:hypothetical protein